MRHALRITSILMAVGVAVLLASAQAQPRQSMGQGTCCLNGFLAPITSEAPAQALTESEVAALNFAIQDEYKSRATYNKVLETFGQVRPFSNIVRAEGRHVDILAQLFTRYGIAIPEDNWDTKVETFGTFGEAINASIRGEIENGALFDTLMLDVKNPELRAAFNALQYATMEHHLPAFQRFAGIQNGQGNGRGQGRGKGLGNRQGNGRGQGFGNGCCNGRGQGLGNGQGKGRGQGLGNRQGNGRGQGLGNRQGNGRGQGLGNGQGNGRGQGLGNRQGNGRGQGLGNRQGNGRGQGFGNGQGNGQGQGRGYRQGPNW